MRGGRGRPLRGSLNRRRRDRYVGDRNPRLIATEEVKEWADEDEEAQR